MLRIRNTSAVTGLRCSSFSISSSIRQRIVPRSQFRVHHQYEPSKHVFCCNDETNHLVRYQQWHHSCMSGNSTRPTTLRMMSSVAESESVISESSSTSASPVTPAPSVLVESANRLLHIDHVAISSAKNAENNSIQLEGMESDPSRYVGNSQFVAVKRLLMNTLLTSQSFPTSKETIHKEGDDGNTTTNLLVSESMSVSNEMMLLEQQQQQQQQALTEGIMIDSQAHPGQGDGEIDSVTNQSTVKWNENVEENVDATTLPHTDGGVDSSVTYGNEAFEPIEKDILRQIDDAIRSENGMHSARAFRRLMLYVEGKSYRRRMAAMQQGIIREQDGQALDQHKQVTGTDRSSRKTFLLMPHDLKEINFVGTGKIYQIFKHIFYAFPFEAYRTLLYYQAIIPKINISRVESQEGEQDTEPTIEFKTTRPYGADTHRNYNQYDEKIDSDDPDFAYRIRLRMYTRLCSSVQYISNRYHSDKEVKILISSIIDDIHTTLNAYNRQEGVQKCFPRLLSAIIQSKTPSCHEFGPYLYNYIQTHNIKVDKSWYEHILSLSKFYRQNVISFPQVMHDAVMKHKARITVRSVMRCVDNLYPFTNFHEVKLVLQCIKELYIQQQGREQHDGDDSQNTIKADGWKENLRNGSYIMDIGTLESLTSAAANHYYLEIHKEKLRTLEHDSNSSSPIPPKEKKRDTSLQPSVSTDRSALEVIMSVWDLLDLYKYRPTVGMYENATSTFIGFGHETYEQGFRLLVEMDRLALNGNPEMKPSLAFLNSLSVFLREDSDHIRTARKTVEMLYGQASTPMTATLFNVVLAALAERGVGTVAMTVFAVDFKKFDVKRNEDTYGLIFEALGKNMSRSRKWDVTKEDIVKLREEVLTDAEYVLSTMDDDDILPNRHLIREYTTLLCHAGEIDTATDVVLDASASSSSDIPTSKLLVDSKTVYNVAMANVRIGKFDVARRLSILYPFAEDEAQMISSIPNLTDNIARMEMKTNKGTTIS